MASNQEKNEGPNLRLSNYTGPYSPAGLMQSRMELQYYLRRMQDTAIWYKISRKTALNIDGPAMQGGGFGEASTVFSHAELPENRDAGEPYCISYDEDYESYTTPDNENQSQTENVSLSEALATVQSDEAEASITAQDDSDEVIVINDELNTANSSVIIVNEDSNDSCIVIDEEEDINLSRKRKHSEIDNSSENGALDNATNSISNSDINVDEQGNEVRIDSLSVSLDSEGNITNKKYISDTKVLDKEGNVLPSGISSDKNANDGKTSFLKCDLCTYQCSTRKNMFQHLTSDVHFTASEYVIRGKYVFLDKKMVLFNFDAKFKNVIVVCPDSTCKKLFPQIHACAQHYSQKHCSSGVSKYGLLRVVKEEECSINANQTISNTNIASPDVKESSNKSEQCKYTGLNNCEHILFCKYCNTSFQSVYRIASHIKAAHVKEVQKGNAGFKVFHCKPMEIHELHMKEATSKSSEVCKKRKLQDVKISSEEKLQKQGSRSGSHSTDSTDNLFFFDFTPSEVTKIQVSSIDVQDDNSNKSTPDLEEESKLSEMYKCDFCLYMTKGNSEMLNHLRYELHFAASTVLADEKNNVVFLRKPNSVIFEGAKFKKIAAICLEPSCGAMFGTIHVCNAHLVHMHKSCDMTYGLAKILHSEVYKLPVYVEHKCYICGQNFKQVRKLTKHQEECRSSCAPVGCKKYTMCCACNQIFPVFYSAWCHLQRHKLLSFSGYLDVIVLYVSKDIQKYTLPPYEANEKGKKESLKNQISNLKAMKRCYGRTGRKNINKKLIEVKKVLNG